MCGFNGADDVLTVCGTYICRSHADQKNDFCGSHKEGFGA